MSKGKVIMENLTILQQQEDFLKKRINDLQIQESNIIARLQSEEVRKEMDQRLEERKAINVANEMMAAAAKLDGMAKQRMQLCDLREQRLNERQAGLEKMEIVIGDVSGQIKKANEIKRTVDEYKTKVMKELNDVLIQIEEKKAEIKRIDSEWININGAKRALAQAEEQFDREKGIFALEKKEFENERILQEANHV